MREPPLYESDYIRNYDVTNAECTISGRFMRKSHQLLESSLPKRECYDRILEVGAGSGHHIQYVARGYREYVMTDKSNKMLEIAREKYNNFEYGDTLKIEEQDAASINYPDSGFDRLIATHVLEHLKNPVRVLREWDRVVRPGGVISIVLPCDPGVLWRLGRHLGPRRNATRLGLHYDYLQAAEHINSIFNLVVFVRHHFEHVREYWYPLILPMPDLNLFYICHIIKGEIHGK